MEFKFTGFGHNEFFDRNAGVERWTKQVCLNPFKVMTDHHRHYQHARTGRRDGGRHVFRGLQVGRAFTWMSSGKRVRMGIDHMQLVFRTIQEDFLKELRFQSAGSRVLDFIVIRFGEEHVRC